MRKLEIINSEGVCSLLSAPSLMLIRRARPEGEKSEAKSEDLTSNYEAVCFGLAFYWPECVVWSPLALRSFSNGPR